MYILQRYDWVNSRWVYYNTYPDFVAVCEARDYYQRRHGGQFRIVCTE